MLLRTAKIAVAAALVLLLLPGTAAADRAQLKRERLYSAAPALPVANRHFLPEGESAPALHRFSGVLLIPEHAMQSEPPSIRPAEVNGKRTQLFPAVELRFESHDGHLVPADRGILRGTGDSYWQIQVEPGRVWSETGDGGLSRASFPFLLTNEFENETYNGVATFLYDDETVSQLRYQVVQQLAPFVVQTRYVAAAQVAVEYERAAVVDRELIEAFTRELEDRLVWRDWSELQRGFGVDLLADFDSGIEPQLVAASGLVIDGEVYVRSMNTPYGAFPYPRQMRHGVWSVTKTAAGLVTLLRMAQKYGDEILDYRIRDYVDVSADHDGWRDVTFRHAMSMATGIGTGTLNVEPNIIGVGDASNPANNAGFDDYMRWYFAPTAAEKLAHVFEVPSYPWGPGVHARYRDRDIFTLSAALAALYRQREGSDASIWQMMMDEVYRPIGIHHLPKLHTQEADGGGIPLLAWGLYVTIDDIAKIAMLLQNGGAHDDVQLLSRAGVAEAMYENGVVGLPTGESNEFGPKSYHLSLWHENYRTEAGNVYTAPRMSGYGGNIVQMMPNGMIGFRFGTGGDRPLEQMTVVADKMRPFDDFGKTQRRLTAR